MNDAQGAPPLEISPADLAARLAAAQPAGTPEAPVLIDVRQPEEHAYVRLEPSRLVPLPELAARLDELKSAVDPTADVILYCHHGVRSQHAAVFLRAHGFPRARSLAGGIEAWTRQVDPSLPRY
ncbi:MAG: rhodanese-like domain-containing protein [Candidatus Eisenbacteria bacterium]